MHKRIALLCILVFGLVSGCAAAPAAQSLPTPVQRIRTYSQIQGGTALTKSSELLAKIWNSYTGRERFAVFGGTPETAVAEGPGDLETADTEMLMGRFFLTREQTDRITEGAAMEHLLNRNVFCAAVFCLAEAKDAAGFAVQLRDSLENARWLDGTPQRFLITQPEEGFVLLAFGQTRVLDTFLIRMKQVFPQGKIWYYEEIVQKRGQ